MPAAAPAASLLTADGPLPFALQGQRTRMDYYAENGSHMATSNLWSTRPAHECFAEDLQFFPDFEKWSTLRVVDELTAEITAVVLARLDSGLAST